MNCGYIMILKKKLDEIGMSWDNMEFYFLPWKAREQKCVLEMNKVNDIFEKLDED